MRTRDRGSAIRASSTTVTVVLLATVGIVVTSCGVGVADARRTSTPATEVVVAADLPRAPALDALAVAEPARAILAPADWVGATPMTASAPVRLQIPAIGVDSELMDLGLNDDGTLEVPPAGFPAGWFTGAPTPGELGPAVIAGHVDWTGPGVFYDLHLLAVDDEVSVTRADGSTATFLVTRVEQYAKAEFPTDEVYGDIDHAGLRLITCGGVFNRETGSHDDNIVVFAALR